MIWTDQRINTLKTMWGRFSARDIARELGEGVSRSAVIGKANRLKLSMAGGGGGSMPRKQERVTLQRVSAKKTVKATVHIEVSRNVSVKSAGVARASQQAAAVSAMAACRQVEQVAFSPSDSLKHIEGISLTKAGERHCRWPIGDPRSSSFRFCGCHSIDGLPYCPDHARMAYQSAGRRQRVSENEAYPEVRMQRAANY